MRCAAATLLVSGRARHINKNPAHQSRAHREEMGAIVPVELPAVEQSEIGFIYECTGLKHVAGPFAGHVPAGNIAQMVVNKRCELLERLVVSRTPSLEQLRDFVRSRQAHSVTLRRWTRNSLSAIPAIAEIWPFGSRR